MSTDGEEERRKRAITPAGTPTQPAVGQPGALIQYQYSGDIPDPNMMRQYEALLPGATQRCFDAVDEERRHRHFMDRWQLMGRCLVGLVAIGAATWLGLTGHEAAASAVGGSGIVTATRAWRAIRRSKQ